MYCPIEVQLRSEFEFTYCDITLEEILKETGDHVRLFWKLFLQISIMF